MLLVEFRLARVAPGNYSFASVRQTLLVSDDRAVEIFVDGSHYLIVKCLHSTVMDEPGRRLCCKWPERWPMWSCSILFKQTVVRQWQRRPTSPDCSPRRLP